MKGEKCQEKDCTNTSTSRSEFCSFHQKEKRKDYQQKYINKWMKGKGMPSSVRKNADTYELWLFADYLKPVEIRVLIQKRRLDLKYEKDHERFQQLRTEILILEKMYSQKAERKRYRTY